MTEFYNIIKKATNAKGMTIQELSKQLDISYMTLMNAKKWQISSATVGKITNFLDLDFNTLDEINKKSLTKKEFNERNK